MWIQCVGPLNLWCVVFYCRDLRNVLFASVVLPSAQIPHWQSSTVDLPMSLVLTLRSQPGGGPDVQGGEPWDLCVLEIVPSPKCDHVQSRLILRRAVCGGGHSCRAIVVSYVK